LLSYSWPGNIRELENVIHFALIVCRDGVIQPEDIKLVPLSSAQPSSQPDASVSWPSALGTVAGGLGLPLGLGADGDARGQRHAAARAAAAAEAHPALSGAHGEAEGSASGASPWAQLEAALSALMAQGEEGLYDRVEAAVVTLGFAHAGQNQVRAAKVLGITRNMVRTQLKRHGLLLDA
jgi:sigma-54-specific transcriptional regulator